MSEREPIGSPTNSPTEISFLKRPISRRGFLIGTGVIGTSALAALYVPDWAHASGPEDGVTFPEPQTGYVASIEGYLMPTETVKREHGPIYEMLLEPTRGRMTPDANDGNGMVEYQRGTYGEVFGETVIVDGNTYQAEQVPGINGDPNTWAYLQPVLKPDGTAVETSEPRYVAHAARTTQILKSVAPDDYPPALVEALTVTVEIAQPDAPEAVTLTESINRNNVGGDQAFESSALAAWKIQPVTVPAVGRKPAEIHSPLVEALDTPVRAWQRATFSTAVHTDSMKDEGQWNAVELNEINVTNGSARLTAVKQVTSEGRILVVNTVQTETSPLFTVTSFASQEDEFKNSYLQAQAVGVTTWEGFVQMIGDVDQAQQFAKNMTPFDDENLLAEIGGMEGVSQLFIPHKQEFAPYITVGLLEDNGLDPENGGVRYEFDGEKVFATYEPSNQSEATIFELVDSKWELFVQSEDERMSQEATRMVKGLHPDFEAKAYATSTENVHTIEVNAVDERYEGINLQTPDGNLMVLVPDNLVDLMEEGGMAFTEEERAILEAMKLSVDLTPERMEAVGKLLRYVAIADQKNNDVNFAKGTLSNEEVQALLDDPNSPKGDLVLFLTPKPTDNTTWYEKVGHRELGVSNMRLGFVASYQEGVTTSGAHLDPEQNANSFLRVAEFQSLGEAGAELPLQEVLKLWQNRAFVYALGGALVDAQSYLSGNTGYYDIFKPYGGRSPEDPLTKVLEPLDLFQWDSTVIETEAETAARYEAYNTLQEEAAAHLEAGTVFDPDRAQELMDTLFSNYPDLTPVIGMK